MQQRKIPWSQRKYLRKKKTQKDCLRCIVQLFKHWVWQSLRLDVQRWCETEERKLLEMTTTPSCGQPKNQCHLQSMEKSICTSSHVLISHSTETDCTLGNVFYSRKKANCANDM